MPYIESLIRRRKRLGEVGNRAIKGGGERIDLLKEGERGDNPWRAFLARRSGIGWFKRPKRAEKREEGGGELHRLH